MYPRLRDPGRGCAGFEDLEVMGTLNHGDRKLTIIMTISPLMLKNPYGIRSENRLWSKLDLPRAWLATRLATSCSQIRFIGFRKSSRPTLKAVLTDHYRAMSVLQTHRRSSFAPQRIYIYRRLLFHLIEMLPRIFKQLKVASPNNSYVDSDRLPPLVIA